MAKGKGTKKKANSTAIDKQKGVTIKTESGQTKNVPLEQIRYLGYGPRDEKAPLGYVTGTEIPRRRSKVAIVGFAPSSMKDVMTMADDPDLEIWGLNQLYMAFPEILPKVTRWFQIHHRTSYDQTIQRDHSHHDWMAQQKDFPIYMQDQNPDVPMCIPFPKDLLIDHFGTYWTNSISWEIALAIYEGFEKIYLFGIDMAQDGEYAFERPSVEFFLGWACGGTGDKCRIVIPEKSDLLKTLWIYPYDDSAPFRAKVIARQNELTQRIQMHASAEQENRDIKNQLLGARDNMQYIMKTWEQSARELATLENRITHCPYCQGNHDFRITPCEEKKK